MCTVLQIPNVHSTRRPHACREHENWRVIKKVENAAWQVSNNSTHFWVVFEIRLTGQTVEWARHPATSYHCVSSLSSLVDDARVTRWSNARLAISGCVTGAAVKTQPTNGRLPSAWWRSTRHRPGGVSSISKPKCRYRSSTSNDTAFVR